jgi:DNA-binding transcriptional LysR family regulator
MIACSLVIRPGDAAAIALFLPTGRIRPLISHDAKFSGGCRVLKVFAAHGLSPKIVLSATDAEVIKACVASGLRIAILQEPAFDRKRDKGLPALAAPPVFEPH